ncbi:Transcription factor bye1 [Balamuthia mandrillaris]
MERPARQHGGNGLVFDPLVHHAGVMFTSLAALVALGLHRPTIGSIGGAVHEGAESILLPLLPSEQAPPPIYTRVLYSPTVPATSALETEILRVNVKEHSYVRVIRSWVQQQQQPPLALGEGQSASARSSSSCYRYDGLYSVTQEKNGGSLNEFVFIRAATIQPPSIYTASAGSLSTALPTAAFVKALSAVSHLSSASPFSSASASLFPASSSVFSSDAPIGSHSFARSAASPSTSASTDVAASSSALSPLSPTISSLVSSSSSQPLCPSSVVESRPPVNIPPLLRPISGSSTVPSAPSSASPSSLFSSCLPLVSNNALSETAAFLHQHLLSQLIGSLSSATLPGNPSLASSPSCPTLPSQHSLEQSAKAQLIPPHSPFPLSSSLATASVTSPTATNFLDTNTLSLLISKLHSLPGASATPASSLPVSSPHASSPPISSSSPLHPTIPLSTYNHPPTSLSSFAPLSALHPLRSSSASLTNKQSSTHCEHTNAPLSITPNSQTCPSPLSPPHATKTADVAANQKQNKSKRIARQSKRNGKTSRSIKAKKAKTRSTNQAADFTACALGDKPIIMKQEAHQLIEPKKRRQSPTHKVVATAPRSVQKEKHSKTITESKQETEEWVTLLLKQNQQQLIKQEKEQIALGRQKIKRKLGQVEQPSSAAFSPSLTSGSPLISPTTSTAATMTTTTTPNGSGPTTTPAENTIANNNNNVEKSTTTKNQTKTENNQEEQVLFCLCRSPYEYGFMICCDSCDEWFHAECIGLSDEDEDEFDQSVFVCPLCDPLVTSLQLEQQRKQRKQRRLLQSKEELTTLEQVSERRRRRRQNQQTTEFSPSSSSSLHSLRCSSSSSSSSSTSSSHCSLSSSAPTAKTMARRERKKSRVRKADEYIEQGEEEATPPPTKRSSNRQTPLRSKRSATDLIDSPVEDARAKEDECNGVRKMKKKYNKKTERNNSGDTMTMTTTTTTTTSITSTTTVTTKKTTRATNNQETKKPFPPPPPPHANNKHNDDAKEEKRNEPTEDTAAGEKQKEAEEEEEESYFSDDGFVFESFSSYDAIKALSCK